MQRKRLGLAIFALGALVMHHTTLIFIWAAIGRPLADYPLLFHGPLAYLPGFTPAIGAILMLVASLIYGHEARR